MSEFLPCPFCGGQAEILSGQMPSGCMAYGVLCQECASRGDIYDTEAEAVDAWNTRAERTCKMEPVWGTNALQCSECCSYVSTWDAECDIGEINYCPNCGARVVNE